MKLCPNCKTELDVNARLCLCCMTSLDEKELILPPVRQFRRWPLVLLCFLILGALLIAIVVLNTDPPSEPHDSPDTSIADTPTTKNDKDNLLTVPEAASTISQTVDGVTYRFRPATREDHPSAITLDNHYVLIQVEGAPIDGIYRVPTFVGQDMDALVTVVADGAFVGTNAQAIDLGHNVRYVWGNAFGGYPLTDLYLHEDVLIEQTAFSGCTENLTIHCPEYLENTEGILWSDLAITLGFQWQSEIL